LLSLKTADDILAIPPKLIFTPTLDNYASVLFGSTSKNTGSFAPTNTSFPYNLFNSALIATVSTMIALVMGVPAAYCFSKYRFRRRDQLSSFILSTRFVPPIAVVLPFFLLFRIFHLLDTHACLIIMYTFMDLALIIWMIKNFFDEVPSEMIEAARMDGCSNTRTLITVALPLVQPGIAAAAILCMLFSWNEFLFAVLFTGKIAKTAPVAVYSFVTFREIVWGNLTAGGIITTIPVLVFILLAQKNLVRGLTAGAVK
jgi:multiple sugar transport system permease protein